MRNAAYMTARLRNSLDSSRFGSASVVPIVDFVLIVAFAVDLLTPFFAWKGMLPGAVSWISQGIAAAAIAVVYTRMMFFDRIPIAVWFIAGISAIGFTVALFRGQGFVATAWGWWIIFKYPLLGLYAYLHPRWPARFPQVLTRAGLVILAFEVLFQLGQYLSGQPIDDNLAGTFGWHGVGHLLFFSVFVLCLALGEWLGFRQWRPLLLALILGSVSSVLAENKIFPIAAALLAALTIAVYIIRGGQLWRLFLLLALLVVGVWIFATGYNTLVPSGRKLPLEELLLDEETRSDYFSRSVRTTAGGRTIYTMGRNFAVGFALGTISEDPVTLSFGFGFGARRESGSLGVSGAALQQDLLSRGSDLVVLIQEMGLFGIATILGFTLWVVIALFRDIVRYPRSPAIGLRYALLLFSVLWPVWLWYKTPLGSRVPMLLYWVSLGYVFGESLRHLHDTQAYSCGSSMPSRGRDAQ